MEPDQLEAPEAVGVVTLLQTHKIYRQDKCPRCGIDLPFLQVCHARDQICNKVSQERALSNSVQVNSQSGWSSGQLGRILLVQLTVTVTMIHGQWS